METIPTGKADSISRRYQIMVIGILKNYNRRYSRQYIIKFVGLMLIYYIINQYIVKFVGFMLLYYIINIDSVSFFMAFNNFYFGYIESIVNLNQ